MAKKTNKYEVIGNVTHDGEVCEHGDIIELAAGDTVDTLLRRGVIKPAGSKEEAPALNNGMEPAAIKENDPGSEKVPTGE